MSAKIIYNNTTIAEIDYGNAATIPVKDLKMEGDIAVKNNEPNLSTVSITPTTSVQTATPADGYDGIGKVTVTAIPSNYIAPSGTLTVTQNGTHSVTSYASVNVQVISTEEIITDVSSESVMTELLTLGTVGAVYRYIGETTETYENGALYVLEVDE